MGTPIVREDGFPPLALKCRSFQPYFFMNIRLQPIDHTNFRACIQLKVADNQTHFVATNMYSLAQAKAESWCVPLAIYADDTMVGFLMYALDPDDRQYWVHRLMIDQRYQGRGYGRAALQQAIELIGALPDCNEIAISYEPENHVAEQLYLSLGFEKTGEIIEGEVVQRLRFNKAPQQPQPISIERIDHLVLTVQSITASCDFYTNILGMNMVRFGNNRTALVFGQQKFNLHEVGHEFEPKARQATPGAADLCLICSTPLDQAAAHLKQTGVAIIEGPVQRSGAHGLIESLYIRDPDGNLIELSRYL